MGIVKHFIPEWFKKYIGTQYGGFRRTRQVYMDNSRRDKKEFSLSLVEFFNLIRSECYYCGAEPNRLVIVNNNKFTALLVNGIDKVDPREGYKTGNVLPCCWECNRMKSDALYDSFLDRVQIIAARHPKTK